MSEKKEKKRFRISMTQITLIFVSVAVICVCVFLVSSRTEKVTTVTENTLMEQLKGISDLATVEYNYTNMGKFEKNNDLNGWTIPLTKASFILAYEGKITAGIHLEEVRFEVNDRQVTVVLPEAEILSHEVDEESVEVYDESSNIFNPIRISDYTAFSAQQKKVMEQRAVEKGLMEEALSRAEEVIVQMLSNANPGYEINTVRE